MPRLLLAFLVAFLLGSTAAAEPGKTILRWHGQSFFEVESSKGTRIVFDPHAIEAFGRREVNADLILLSHLHDDHTQTGVIVNAAQAKVIHGLKGMGRKTDWVVVDEPFKDVRVRSVGVYHDTVEGMERGKNTVFILEVDGLRIVHLGDLGHVLSEKDVKRIGSVDVLLIPVGGVYTINGSEAKKVVEQLKPKKYIVPMHYGVKGYDNLLTAEEFLDEQPNAKKFLGNKLTIEPDFKPAVPVVAILDWKS